MKTLILSDWHNYRYYLPENEIDLLITLGDFNWQTIDWLDKRYHCPKIGVLGNHDRMDTYKGTNFVHLHEKTIEIGGLVFAGFDGCPRYNGKNTPQYEEEDVSKFIQNLGGVDVFLAHANPQWGENGDKMDAHRGFLSFKEYVEKERPMYFLHGHNHIDEQFEHKGTKIISVYPSYVLDIRSFL